MSVKRALLTSCAIILLCMTLVIGTSWSLFGDTKNVNHHLQAGKLEITLLRTKLQKRAIDENTGYLIQYPDNDEVVVFDENNDGNVFDLDENSLIVPCCKYSATMKVENNSDVAFAYWIEIVFDDSENLPLADQLELTVTTESDTKAPVSQGLEVGSAISPIDTLEIGEYSSFTVSVEFLDSSDNNAAKAQNLNFDLVVHAIQVTNAPSDS